MSIGKGNLYVVAAPSGTGKTTLVKDLIDAVSMLMVSISHTTRSKRPEETEGNHYYFISPEKFAEMVNQNEFLEHATIFGNFYGTSKAWVTETLLKGYDVILEIDWQGYQQIKKLFKDTIGVFILPPSLKILRERLIKRENNPENVEKRLKDIVETITHVKEFDYLVINDDFMTALHDLRTIIESNRLKTKRQIMKHTALIDELKHL